MTTAMSNINQAIEQADREYWAAFQENRPMLIKPSDLRCLLDALEPRRFGDAGDALDFALDHLESKSVEDFLEDWRADQFDRWPEYLLWLGFQRKCAAEARAVYQSIGERG